MLESLAHRYLAGLSPSEIRSGLPRWLATLSQEQWLAVVDAAETERQRRARELALKLVNIGAPR